MASHTNDSNNNEPAVSGQSAEHGYTITVKLAHRTAQALMELTAGSGDDEEQVVADAVGLYHKLRREVADGGTVQIVRADGKVFRLPIE